jgi:hypothetical protein
MHAQVGEQHEGTVADVLVLHPGDPVGAAGSVTRIRPRA